VFQESTGLMGGKGGTISRLHNVLQTVFNNVFYKVTPSLGKAVVGSRSIGGTTTGRYSDSDFEEDLTLILATPLKKGYEIVELK
jgi:hypothetical protein